MKLIYISQGNIPARWAHTFQAMKMAEAFGEMVPDFALLTQAHWSAPFRRRFDYERWYGIRTPFAVKPLLTRNAPADHVFEGVRYPRFDERAARYARRRNACVYTRSAYAALCAASCGAPTVLETHMETEHPEFSNVLAACGHSSLRGVVTITRELADRYREAGLDTAPIHVWPDCVNPKSFEGLPEQAVLQESLELPEGKPLVVYCGNLYPDRGLEDVLKCAGSLPEAEFVFVGGWDKDVAQWRETSRDLANVRFTGFAENAMVPRYLMAADILLMPNSTKLRTAAWMSPMKMFEYMAAGKPMVASDHAVLHQVLADGKSCLFVPPDDADAMRDALKRLLADPELCRKLGEGALEAVAPYTWRKRAGSILEAFFPHLLQGDRQ